MLKDRVWRIVSISIALVMLLTTTAFAADITPTEEVEGYVSDAEEKVIQNLLDQRAVILNEYFMNEGANQNNRSITKLNMVDLELIRCGVTFLTEEQVEKQFPDAKIRKSDIWQETTIHTEGNAAIEPCIDTPESDVNQWTTYRKIYTYNGVTYNIQKLIAQPIKEGSALARHGDYTVRSERNWTAGAENVLSVAASNSVDGLVSSIPGAGLALTFFDMVKGLVEGISITTEVKVPHITYSWSCSTTAVFSYVRLIGESDDDQWLSLISTKANTYVEYMTSSFDRKLENGIWKSESGEIQGSRNIDSTPSQYNSDEVAVIAYNSVLGGYASRCVSFIDITGPESKRAAYITSCIPACPVHCE